MDGLVLTICMYGQAVIIQYKHFDLILTEYLVFRIESFSRH